MTILGRQSYEYLSGEIPKWEGNYLEIGVFEGDMLRDFALRWPKKMFYGIDPFIADFGTTGHTGVPDGGSLEVQKALALAHFDGVPNIKFFLQTSKSFLEETSYYDMEKMNVSVVYVDGAHSYEHTLNDLHLASRLIKHRGLIFVDDFDLPEVLQATNDFLPSIKDRIIRHDGRSIVLK